MAALTLGALGVVFGDIGTSPLYALQTVFTADSHAVHTTPGEVYGVISLVFWSITIIVSVKYVSFIMRADNQGEGGIMALTALLDGARIKSTAAKLTFVTLGILGASLFYGDGVITPAISVLSAVSGLKVAAREEGPLRDFVDKLDARDFPVQRVPGTAVFLNANPRTTPLALRANVEHNHVLHEQVIIISIETERVPHVSDSDRLVSDHLGHPADGITGLTARFGYQDRPNIPATLRIAVGQHLLEDTIHVDQASYFLSQMTIVPTDAPGMSSWRKKLFLTMAHNAANPARYFGLPDDRTVIMGARAKGLSGCRPPRRGRPGSWQQPARSSLRSASTRAELRPQAIGGHAPPPGLS